MIRSISFFKSGYHNSKWFLVLAFTVIFCLANMRQSRITNFDCEICSDKAGYYMYLPAIVHLGFHAKNYPDGFDHAHGDGFHIDREHDKIITKFTYGVAALQLPFYTAGALIAKIFSLEVSPYSNYYMFFINLGAVFYLMLGLYFLRKWLNYYVDDVSSFWTILTIFLGTNIYYYTLDESLMSHVYSFSLFSMVLYGYKTFSETKRFSCFLLFIISLSLAIVIRPTNILFFLIALLADVNTLEAIKNKIVLLLTPKYLITGVVLLFLILLPQLLYWKFAYDKYIVWSYTGEGFINWKNPEFAAVWFSPQSGLFIYTPIILLSLVYAVVMFGKKEKNAVLVLGSFLLVSYMCAAWSNPYFGTCNFGKRPMVEFLPMIMFPIAYMFEYAKSYQITSRYFVLIVTFILIYYNQALFKVFDTCFFGAIWEWDKFLELLKKAFI